jgi:uncharacterized membrane protein YdjX (TVP38/TMEM64 family)
VPPPEDSPGTSSQERAATDRRARGGNRFVLAGMLLLMLLLVLGGSRWLSGASPDELANLGYLGVFLAMLASGGSTFFPVPGHLAVFASATVWQPVLVGVAAGLGNSTGESIAFLAWRAAAGLAEPVTLSRFGRSFSHWFDRNGFLAILAIAVIPNPVFDVVGMVAAAARYPLRRFWLACALGNVVKYIGMAYLSRAAISLFG